MLSPGAVEWRWFMARAARKAGGRRRTDRLSNELLSEWRELVRALRATRTLTPPNSSPALQDAFQYFELDPENPTDRAWLLAVLANVCFGKRSIGRPKNTKKWHAARLHLLAIHREKVMHGDPNLTEQQAAQKIKKRYRIHYQHDSVETIRQRLGAARKQAEWARSQFGVAPQGVREAPTSRINSKGLLPL
jgi:hypothetical protein